MELKKIFGIPSTGQRRFFQNGSIGVVECDGYCHQDLAHITLEKISEYLEIPRGNDFYLEFGKVVAKIEGTEIKPTKDEVDTDSHDSVSDVPVTKSRGFKKKS